MKDNNLLEINRSLLEVLLKDNSTGRNILWATDDYLKFGSACSSDKEIKINQVLLRKGGIIKPRIEKTAAEQRRRVRQKAEVFTPSWVCNMQNNRVDEEWFGRKCMFNIEEENRWKTIADKISFPASGNKTWQDYVLSERLEISCGEAPYITSRYDAVTGECIDVANRIGLLDRKLRVVSENTEIRDDWIEWACRAVQNVYGFDWQGDNVFIARENLLFTIAEYYEVKFREELESGDLLRFAKVISWNIWQMDGLRFVIPNSCCVKETVEADLFESKVVRKPCEGCASGDNKKHNGIYCMIKDWKRNRKIRFADIVSGSVR